MLQRTTRTILTFTIGLALVSALLYFGGLLARASELSSKTQASGDVYCVTPQGGTYSGCTQVFTNVQAAVDAANSGETIKIAAGTYTGVHARSAPEGYDGPSVITQVVYISKTVHLSGGYTTTDWSASNPVSYPTTLDAENTGRVILIGGYASPTIQGLNITGGDATRLGGILNSHNVNGAGGGLYVLTATTIISGCSVFDNAGDESGGGLYLNNSSIVLRDSLVFSNSVSYGGGGIYVVYSSVTLTNNAILSNTAFAGGGLRVGVSNVTLDNNTIAANRATYGGGYISEVSDAVMNGNTFHSNSAEQWGGGLALDLASPIVLNGNTILSNTAGTEGGGLFAYTSGSGYGGNVTWSNNIIAGNRAETAGSGLWQRDVILHLLHTTIAHNTGGDGSGVRVSNGTATLTNTILVGHTVGITVAGGSTATLSATLWDNITDWDGAGTILTGTQNWWGDPAFTCTEVTCTVPYRIGRTSAARDRGVWTEIDTDIDGEPRDSLPDLGADEYIWEDVYLPCVMRQVP